MLAKQVRMSMWCTGTHNSVQAMLYATDGITTDDDFNKAMVGVASVWCALILPLGSP